MKKIFGVVLLLALSGCAGKAPVRSDALAKVNDKPLNKFSLAFTSSRHREFRTCGCLEKLGGLHRELNFLEGWRKEVTGPRLVLSGGITFLESTADSHKYDRYRKAAEPYIGALNDLGLDVLSPSITDMALGLSTMKALEKKSSFPWVSANLFLKGTQKPVFERYREYQFPNLTVLVTGVSSLVDAYLGGSDIEVRPAAAALNALLAELPKKPRLVIVLTDMSKDERTQFVSEAKGVNLILGDNVLDYTGEVDHVTPELARFNVDDRGRAIGRIDLDIKGPISGFNIPQLAKLHEEAKASEQKALADLDAKVKKAKGKKKKALLAEREALAKKATSAESSVTAGDTGFHYQIVNLSEKFDQPKNKMTAFMEAADKQENEAINAASKPAVENKTPKAEPAGVPGVGGASKGSPPSQK